MISNTAMAALAKTEPCEGLTAVEAPVPDIGPSDVLIKVSKTGICGTDMHIWKWDDWARRTVPIPMVVGHEYAGEIVAVGREVHGLSIGQRVSGEGHIVGQKSRAARAGRFHLDPETRGIGVNIPGAFAEYLALPAFNVVPLPDEVDDEIGAILDPLGNAVHTALSFDILGEDILITGAGPIGIMAAIVARHAGARHIVITDVNQSRLDLAARLVDVVPVNSETANLHDEMDRLGLREGFDVGFEMSGAPKAFEQMVETLVMGGRIAFLGLPSRPMLVDWSSIVLKSLVIKGVYGREMFETWYKMLAMLQTGLDVRGVITHRLPASEFRKGFEAIRKGEASKVVLDWSDARFDTGSLARMETSERAA
jgi:threonine 3-dehydrogenase